MLFTARVCLPFAAFPVIFIVAVLAAVRPSFAVKFSVFEWRGFGLGGRGGYAVA